MKNKGLIITLIILLTIIVIALIAFLGLALSGNITFKNGFSFRIGKSENIILDKNYDIENINNIEILLNSGDIKVEKSNEPIIRVVAYGENTEDVKNYDLFNEIYPLEEDEIILNFVGW